MKELPLNGFYAGESKKLSDRRCINFIPVPNDEGAFSTMSLMPTMGLGDPKVVAASSVDAGEITSQVFTYSSAAQGKSVVFVRGDKIILTSNELGSSAYIDFPNAAGDPLPIISDYARMTTNGIEMVIVCSSNEGSNTRDKLVYVLPDLTTVAVPVATIFGNTNIGLVDVAFAGGRFLYVANQTVGSNYNRVFYSAIGGVDPDPLDFFSPDNLASQLKGIDVINDRIYLFSENKTFIYSVTSSTDIPFRDTGEIEYGLYDADAKCRYRSAIAGLFKGVGGSYFVGLLSGGGVQQISNPTINYQIQNFLSSTGSGAKFRLFSFSDNGRDMLCVTCNGFTLCFEAATGMWHERKTMGDRANWQFIGAADDPDEVILIGDRVLDLGGDFGGEVSVPICSVDYDLGTEAGDLIERIMISAPFNDKNQRMMVDELQPQCEVDYSLPIDGWPEAKINISMSHDFGNTFEQERGLNIGRAGDYTQETRFFGMGYVKQAFVVKLRSINPYPTRILRLLSRITKGGS